MSPSQWGPPIWIFLHTLAEKIDDAQFTIISPSLFGYLRRIMTLLPCPDCANHAIQFLNQVNFANIKTRTDFANILCIFHNVVNRRKRKPNFDRNTLTETYANQNLVTSYNNFISVFHTGRNFKLLADSMQRKLLVKDFRAWLGNQLGRTILLQQPPAVPP